MVWTIVTTESSPKLLSSPKKIPQTKAYNLQETWWIYAHTFQCLIMCEETAASFMGDILQIKLASVQ